jgi:hypothetical protein
MPTQDDNLKNDKSIGATDTEADEVHEAGYRDIIAGLLWFAYHSLGVSGAARDTDNGHKGLMPVVTPTKSGHNAR